MFEKERIDIAQLADMIVNGYAFLKDGNNIKIINLEKKDPHVMEINKSGKMLESSMDEVEQTIALEIWEDNKEFMEICNA